MKQRMAVLAVAVALAAIGGQVALPDTAHAATAPTGTLTMTSDPGDYIGAGQDYDYATTAGDIIASHASTDGTFITVGVDAANGDWWYLDFAAPRGEALAPGTYPGATRASFRDEGEPGLDVGGNGRGCNELTGSFTVNAVEFGPDNEVPVFDATFEQHCEGFEPALRGHVVIGDPPPEALDLGVAVAATGTARSSGNATVSGTVTCTQPVRVVVRGRVRQVVDQVVVRGVFEDVVACTPGAEVAWQASAAPDGTTPFQQGRARVRARARAQDPADGTRVIEATTAVVHLETEA